MDKDKREASAQEAQALKEKPMDTRINVNQRYEVYDMDSGESLSPEPQFTTQQEANNYLEGLRNSSKQTQDVDPAVAESLRRETSKGKKSPSPTHPPSSSEK